MCTKIPVRIIYHLPLLHTELMGKQEGKEQMRTFILGTDRGNAVVTALILIMALSIIFITLVPRISAIKRFSHDYKVQVIHAIEERNREIINLYGLH
jgi:hypothetical protein